MLIPIGFGVTINEDEIEETFVRASGPGGQNVNKVATAAQLRFAARLSPGVPPEMCARLEKLAGRRMTQDGVIIITARRHRTQDRNRAEALERLVELLREAAKAPIRRRATRVGAGAIQRRRTAKMQHSARKAGRKSIGVVD